MDDIPNLSIGDAARILGVSVDTVRRWSDEGRVPVVVLPSGHRRYRLADVEALAAGGAA
jgi:putative resolvase